MRVSGVSSTDAEHELALERACRIRDWLREEFQFPDPVSADSGNGGHLNHATRFARRACRPVCG